MDFSNEDDRRAATTAAKAGFLAEVVLPPRVATDTVVVEVFTTDVDTVMTVDAKVDVVSLDSDPVTLVIFEDFISSVSLTADAAALRVDASTLTVAMVVAVVVATDVVGAVVAVATVALLAASVLPTAVPKGDVICDEVAAVEMLPPRSFCAAIVQIF